MSHPEPTITLRLTCLNPPSAADIGRPFAFGLQDAAQQLHAGTPQRDGALLFVCQVQVRRRAADPAPDFAGPFVHGPPSGRFLYLSLRAEDQSWIRRIKVPLGAITWEQIEAASAPSAALAARVPGDRAATVRPLDGWTLSAE